MGTQIGKLLSKCRHEIEYSDLYGKKIGIDAYNMIYAFLAPIRYRETGGGYLTDSDGNVTSHLSGLFYRMTNLLPYNIRPVFIFDGKPPIFKEKEIEIRKDRKKEAALKREEALAKGDLESAMKFAAVTSKITPQIIDDARRLVEYFGVPTLQAASEAEAQGAYMVQEGMLDAMASQDYDSFLFGSPQVIRNLTVTRRRVPTKQGNIELNPEKVILGELLEELNFENRDQLILLGLLVGTDYNPGGIRGIGPKTALKLVHQYNSPNSLLEYLDAKYSIKKIFPHPPKGLLDYFRSPEVDEDIKFTFRKPQLSKIKEFLVEERDFGKDRIEGALQRMVSRRRKIKQKADQRALDQFF
ncbi:MAG: flap endonuclease-1 [Candidatus Heimdallarchaeota archaeon]|nr:MAG: flap endonuclease-1 [Candidatus Heimdallarchaeota archaeon]